VHLGSGETKWLAGAILAGGIVAPVLLMWGLSRMPASSTALLLNAEGVLTALLAWFVFHENFDRRIAVGMAMIVAGAVVLTGSGDAGFDSVLPPLAVLGACLGWAIDNNLTRKVALADAAFIAMVKGLAAGTTNVAIAWLLGAMLPSAAVLMSAGAVGFLSYGLSLVLFVVALRHLGTARTGAYFSTAPFVGALVAIPLLGEPLSIQFMVAAAFMAGGVWLHLTERHEHFHTHETVEHEHEHTHDDHHAHAEPVTGAHAHRHRHAPLAHSHSHYPDAHHRHHHE
jgi:drug/metabolite transporter (DMT)-like permease